VLLEVTVVKVGRKSGGLTLHVLLKELVGEADRIGYESFEVIRSEAGQSVESSHDKVESRDLLLRILQVFLKNSESV
jgi:hypothetical protein